MERLTPSHRELVKRAIEYLNAAARHDAACAVEDLLTLVAESSPAWVEQLAADLKRMKEMRVERDAAGIEEDAVNAFAWCIAELRARAKGDEHG